MPLRIHTGLMCMLEYTYTAMQLCQSSLCPLIYSVCFQSLLKQRVIPYSIHHHAKGSIPVKHMKVIGQPVYVAMLARFPALSWSVASYG